MLLCVAKNKRGIFIRRPQDGSDHPQRIPQGDVAHEVAAVALFGHPVDELGGQFGHTFLQLLDRDRREPGIGQQAKSAMVGTIHLNDGARHLGAAGAPTDVVFLRDGAQGGTWRVDEDFRLALDFHHIVMPCDGPEGAVALGLSPAHWGIGAQLGEHAVKTGLIRIGGGVGDGGIDRGVVHVCLQLVKEGGAVCS
ncbi:hypothetical protein D3C71_1404320 [compost metagenome]